MSIGRLAWAALVLLALPPVPARAIDITECGQTIPSNETGVLMADLSFCNSQALKMGDRTTLQMNGHTISDTRIGVAIWGRRFTITGPGTFARTYYAIFNTPDRRSKVSVSDVTFDDNEGAAIVSLPSTVVASNLVITNTGEEDPYNSAGIAAYGLRGTNLTITGNFGVGTQTYRQTRLVNSTVTGNNGYLVGVDVFAEKTKPRLINSTCGKSAGRHIGATAPGETWGVCANDP